MLEIMKFIFSSFWIWLGTFLFLAVVAAGIGNTLILLRGGSKRDNDE